MDDHLSIAVGVEVVTASFEFGPQFAKVVNLSVEDNSNRLVLVVDGLPSAS